MENRQTQFNEFSQTIIKRTLDFFELTSTKAQPQMQATQIATFLQQAFTKHYQLSIQFNQDDHLQELNGQLIQAHNDQYVLKTPNNVFKIFKLQQVRFIKRIPH